MRCTFWCRFTHRYLISTCTAVQHPSFSMLVFLVRGLELMAMSVQPRPQKMSKAISAFEDREWLLGCCGMTAFPGVVHANKLIFATQSW